MRIASVLTGIFLVIAMYIAIVCFAANHQSQHSPQSADLTLPCILNAFLIFFPVAFFLAGIVTGVLAQPYIEKNIGEILFTSPGLYCVLLGDLIFLLGYNSAGSITANILMIAAWIGVGLLSITTSALGVLVGYVLRAKITGDDQPQETWRL